MADWQREIVEQYSYAFSPRFTFEVGDGWATLLRELMRRIDLVLDADWKDGASFRVTQCKEKYGSLRFYSSGPDEVERIVDWAEEVSLRTCDVCGGPGRMRREGWLAVRCDKHAS